MDIISHGLWDSLAFVRSTRKSFWLAFFFGISPDLFSFGVYMTAAFFGLTAHPDWSSGQHPDPSQIPAYVYGLYNFTHSLIVFTLAFGLVWLARKKPPYELSAWGLHIVVDIPTHSYIFFPTPFLWPLSDFSINGIPWGDPIIFIPNVTILVALYLWFFVIRRRTRGLFDRNSDR